MDGVELLGFAARQVNHLGSYDLQASGLETGIDLADNVLGHGIRLDDRQCAFYGHDILQGFKDQSSRFGSGTGCGAGQRGSSKKT